MECKSFKRHWQIVLSLNEATNKISSRHNSESDCKSLADKTKGLGPILCRDPLFPAHKLYCLQVDNVRKRHLLYSQDQVKI